MKANIRLLLTIVAVSAIIFACLLQPTEITVTIAVLTRVFVVSAGLMTVIRDWPKPNWMVLGFVVCSIVSFLALDRASYSTPMFRESIIKIYGLDLDVDPTENFNQYVRVTTQAIHLILSLAFGIIVSFAIPVQKPSTH